MTRQANKLSKKPGPVHHECREAPSRISVSSLRKTVRLARELGQTQRPDRQ
jgi:hypothetical protein